LEVVRHNPVKQQQQHRRVAAGMRCDDWSAFVVARISVYKISLP
jgi:hypothetical protein